MIKFEVEYESSECGVTPVALDDNRDKFICDFCGLTLFSRSGIHSHLIHKHLGLQTPAGAQLKTEICNICGVYTTKRNFKDHVNSHSKDKNFKCEFCGSAVKSIFTLRKHIKKIHMKVKSFEASDPRFECCTCKKYFTTAEGLKRHDLRYHIDSYQFVCVVCGKKSLTIAENNYHMKIHSFERKFQCQYCDFRFSRSEALKNHLIKHKDEWSYSCGICVKSFKHSSSVSGHRKLHKVNGFYHCGCCDARFNDYGQLKNHFVNTSHSFYPPVKKEID
ncbi:Zinc finger protein [Pseudolycoriella hygida]|uniref:Zinc finger protein n=1 Tax=Pseudolycoriella hygida TaxID=35572 RepID=A0A9Q0S959_9DIPT|nr:Zinc finger protein [Pseudolycoriella hygida]